MAHQREPLQPAELRGYGLELRSWEQRDADAVLRGLTDPEFLRWNTQLRPVDDLSDAREFVRSRADGWESGEFAHFAVVADGEVAGHVGISMIEREMGSATVGYWVLPEARGRGIAGRALELCTRWAFDEVGLHRLELGHALGHEVSCRIAERAGYSFEGVLRGAMHESGRRDAFRDVHLHARLATDPPPSGGGPGR
ncbi:GNAT family N-acetyltransferase [Streptomyces meridianus]|uniref:GNAT family N-acetyltransferase n=1 Tax=Streptomyces meridianus TaxID=2938945 RepID=A0ABT0X2V1_9ACTN|nr:GNAT family N-acetyltransferase [Streptomyces meridianus]MCM2576779.1 GNAT family N-acetyltransferase [Streptomyces meridianus]